MASWVRCLALVLLVVGCAKGEGETDQESTTPDAGTGTIDAFVPPPDAAPPVGPVCGNGTCEAGETTVSCAADCTPPAVCGNGLCETGETAASCAADCAPPPADSCAGLCGGSADSCYCDDSCQALGDCCPDYVTECGGTTTDSCVGLCGGSADFCYCDAECESLGDCCPDYATACP
jgi:hypothetical protein